MPLVEGGIDTDPSQPYGDHHMLLLDADVCRLWELYHCYPDPKSGWDIFGSASFDLRSNALRPDGWTSAEKDEVAAWYEGTGAWKGGNSFPGFLQNIFKEALGAYDLADRRDEAAVDGDVARAGRPPRSVGDRAAADDQVVHGCSSPALRCAAAAPGPCGRARRPTPSFAAFR